MQYFLLFVLFATSEILFTLIYDIRIKPRFCDNNPKQIVKENSVIRKILLKKSNKDFPLLYILVVPFFVNVILLILALIVYFIYWFSYHSPIGNMLTTILTSLPVLIFCSIWFIGWSVYIGILRFLS